MGYLAEFQRGKGVKRVVSGMLVQRQVCGCSAHHRTDWRRAFTHKRSTTNTMRVQDELMGGSSKDTLSEITPSKNVWSEITEIHASIQRV